MKQACCVGSRWPVQAEAPDRRTLPPRMIESAALRLRWLALISAAISVLSYILERWLQPEVAAMLANPLFSLLWLFVVLLALGIAAVQFFGLLRPTAILRLGVLFEIAVAFVLSTSETGMQMPSDSAVFGIPSVALWIVVVGLIIPRRPIGKLASALACASAWPAAYFMNLYLFGYEPLPLNRLLVWMYLPYLNALGVYALSRRIYAMEVAAQQAHELGSYKIISRIGAGGMGEVWRAEHVMLARDAAIKVIRADLMAGLTGSQAQVTRRRFKREAQAIASLQCPHTVYLFDFGVSDEGSFYYVMELLDGISLDVLVNNFGPQPAGRVVHFLKQVCESLEEAHRHGLVHRDIKPSNIFACSVGMEYDFAKVLDFGLVKNLSMEETMHLTMDGSATGTPAYMAPEIALGERTIDGRVDLYGLGCVAYFMLTGSPVFEEKTPTATALAHIQKPPVPPSQRSEIPVTPELEEIILRCLAKNPEDRPRSAQHLGRLLDACTQIPKWTRDEAAEWWLTHLPESSSYRIARQPRDVSVTPVGVA